ncbi:MAG: radical SAM-associated putative lipoprotein [Dysgonamonadaceae bacterium]|nr:radical SAM-associated putative lipoprotein [Dysgonamonadaceae bacterium]
MNIQWLKLFDKVIVALLGVAGLLMGCNIVFETPAEYGMPHADFVLKGTVTSAATSQPVKNIQVVRPFWEYGYGYEGGYAAIGDTVYTDENGKFAFEFDGLPTMKYQLKLKDIDGQENGGQFVSKEIEGEFTKADQEKKGNDRWYDGKFVKTRNVLLDWEDAVVPMYGVRPAPFQP